MNKEGNCCSLGFRFSFPRQSEVKCSRSSVCGNEGCWRAAWSPLSGASARLCSTLSSSSLRVVIRLLQWRGTRLSLFFFILSVEVFAFTCSVTIWGSEGKKHYGVNTLCGGSQSLCWGYYQGGRTSNPKETHNTTHSPLCANQIAHISLLITLQLLTQTQEPTNFEHAFTWG